MTVIWAETALLPTGWARDVAVEIAADGRIAHVAPGAAATGTRVGVLLPAPVNAHSHAFQRAMAGLTERRGPDGQDSFWTWRRLMFRFLERLTPAHVEAIAAFVQMEMLEAGYAACAEFHYLHHQPDGRAYDNPAEMSARIAAAAAQSGIGLCLLPVQYQFGGCDGRGLAAGQVRFGTTPDAFADIHAGAVAALSGLPGDAGIGAAAHSLRAVGAESLASFAEVHPNGPLHMHLAEQRAEVGEVEAAWGARPVTWALEYMDLGPRWCLIHCTQMTPDETEALARTGAVAGLCPITESNLGDGIFDAVRWMAVGGSVAIGSDSNIRVALAGELRTLEYSQRLRDGTRAALAAPGQSTGRRLYEAALAGGEQAAARDTGRIAAGAWADLLSLDAGSVHLAGRSEDQALDTWLFAANDRLVSDVWAAGRHMVRDGAHVTRDAITHAYRRATCAPS